MNIFIYDKTFEGLLTVVFDAYFRRCFPDLLLQRTDQRPLFYDEVVEIHTDTEKADRVWKGLQKKLSPPSLSFISCVWLSELPESDRLLVRYIRKVFDTPHSIELNFGDADVLAVSRIGKQVAGERLRVIQFLRFQQASDGTFFAPVKPLYNVLPLTLEHLKDRFGDQHWLIYDLKRAYGYYYDQKEVIEVSFAEKEAHLIDGILSETLLDPQEKQFQQLWQTYFKATSIRERLNPNLQRKNMPVRFWAYMPEKRSHSSLA